MMRLRAERLEQERREKDRRANIRLANRDAQQAIVLAKELEEAEELAAQLRDARTEMYSTNYWPKPDQGMYSTDFITYLETVFMLKSHMIQWTNAGLNTIPALVGHFDWIQELNLSNNNLKLIPIFIFTLPNIRKLYLHHNKIMAIPSFASQQWAELQLLDLHNNSLTELPDLSHCKNLTTLDCERNFLKTFPEGIGECEKLYHLNLKHNQIRLIPGVLGVFATRKLSYLNLRNNPIVNLPPHVYQKGMKATMDFLNEHSSGDMMARIEPRDGLAKSLLSLISQPNPLLADVTLTAKDGTSYPAHAIVLFARCTVLKERIEKMDFRHLSKPSPEALPAIHVPSPSGYSVSIEPLVDLQPINPAASSHLRVIQLDISSDELRSLLHYLYGDVYVCPSLNLLAVDLSMTPEQISELSHANDQLTKAHRKQMDDLIAVANKFRLPHWKMLIEQAFGIKTTVAVESDWVPQMRAIWSSSHLFDVSFNCSEGPSRPLIDAHRVIIASRSQFLRALLAGHMVEAKQRIVTLPEVSHTVMKAIVEFCYTEDVETLDPETVIELLTTAKVYGLKKLQNLVESVVGYSLDVDNVASILTIAWTHAMPQLARACKFFVISNWNSVTAGPDWNSIDPAVREKLHQTAVKWKVTPAHKK
jgi:Leucine-rich repeat (LRR) protein